MATQYQKLVHSLKQQSQRHFQEFKNQSQTAAELIKRRSLLIDEVLTSIWRAQFNSSARLCLIAVGGYGREELFPYSDIDILILYHHELEDEDAEAISHFLTTTWDTKLELSHSVRNLSQCVTDAKNDISIFTNLLDARLITGDIELFADFQQQLIKSNLWDKQAFFTAKLEEQKARHKKYFNTAYYLEPDIKNFPGNLRDIHTVYWMAKYLFGMQELNELVSTNMITEPEYLALLTARDFIWQIRYALHALAKRREERLLFDYQLKLAKLFGFHDKSNNLAVEQFMKRYFRAVNMIVQLNEMMVQLFEEKLIDNHDQTIKTKLNDKFVIINGYIGVSHEQVIIDYPQTLIELFTLMSQEPTIKGIRAHTIRLLRRYRYLIDDTFRDNPKHQQLFMTLLKQPYNVAPALRLMSRYGILSRYIPEFDHIVGQMQYDLFHIYTVDQHTMVLINNIYGFVPEKGKQKFPLCHTLINRIQKRELLYIAALFHDMGKGREGNHSQLGAEFANAFCQRHGLNHEDTDLVCWLVANHLLMSETAQRKDIHDHEIIRAFARIVKHRHYLDYLYVLTVADIRATNSKLWNSWKDALFKELFHATQAVLSERHKALSKSTLIKLKKDAAMMQLADHFSEQQVHELWQQIGEDYFVKENENSIAWHSEAILKHKDQQLPLILVRTLRLQGATQIFVHCPDQDNLFATTTAILDRCHLNIVEARISTSTDGYSLDTFMVLDEYNKPVTDPKRMDRIQALLTKYHRQGQAVPEFSQRHIPLQLQHFQHATKVYFRQDKKRQCTQLIVTAADRPGLLARIGRAFVDCDIRLHNAKIITLGDKVEDRFVITDRRNQPIKDKWIQRQLRKRIIEFLGAR